MLCIRILCGHRFSCRNYLQHGLDGMGPVPFLTAQHIPELNSSVHPETQYLSVCNAYTLLSLFPPLSLSLSLSQHTLSSHRVVSLISSQFLLSDLEAGWLLFGRLGFHSCADQIPNTLECSPPLLLSQVGAQWRWLRFELLKAVDGEWGRAREDGPCWVAEDREEEARFTRGLYIFGWHTC